MINNRELQKLQELTKLSFTKEETTTFFNKLESVLGLIDQLKTINCDDIEPLRSVCQSSKRMRLDNAEIADISEELFKNVPKEGADFAKEVKCFIVPKMVE
jgi:aspartyl-tRNA(Asn)/glutamyl-tRNA(Gln) amidotransferase subunit C